MKAPLQRPPPLRHRHRGNEFQFDEDTNGFPATYLKRLQFFRVSNSYDPTVVLSYSDRAF